MNMTNHPKWNSQVICNPSNKKGYKIHDNNLATVDIKLISLSTAVTD